MTTSISMLAIDLAKGSFQVCAVAPEGGGSIQPKFVPDASGDASR